MTIHNPPPFFLSEKEFKASSWCWKAKNCIGVIASCLLQCPPCLQLHACEPHPIPTQHTRLLCASAPAGALHKQHLWGLCEMSPMSWHLGASALGSMVCSGNGEIICSELNIHFWLLPPKHPRTASYREGQALGLWRAGAMSHSPVTYSFPWTEAKLVEEKMAEQCRDCSETHGKSNGRAKWIISLTRVNRMHF